jgi:hypothetical protein
MSGQKQSMVATPYIEGGHTKWDLAIVGGQHGGYGHYPTLSVAPGQAATPFEITIQNSPGSNWKFVKDAGALWVNTGPNDPTGPSTVGTQIPQSSIQTHNQDSVLNFTDLNQGLPVTLHYTLNFVNANGQTSSTLDPIIQNGGGGPPPPPPPPPVTGAGPHATAITGTSTSGYLGHIAGIDVAALVIGLIIGLIIGLLLCRRRRRAEADVTTT